MEFIYLLAGLVVGLVGGYFVSRKLSASDQEFQQLERQVVESKTSLEKYQQEVAEHLDSSTKLLAQMNDACQTALVQMEKSTQLLRHANTESTNMPFFSSEAQAHLRDNADKTRSRRNRKVAPLDEAPRDYAGDGSGLFNDDKHVASNNPL